MTSIPILLDRVAASRGAATALRTADGRAVSYRQLVEQTSAVSAYLSRSGVGRSDRVLVPVSNTVESVVSLLGALSAGVAVPVNPAAAPAEVSALVRKAGAAAMVDPGDAPATWLAAVAADRIVALPKALDAAVVDAGEPAGPTDAAVLMATSGSISSPRMVVLSHAQWVAGARRVVDTFSVGPDDRTINLMPLFHNHGANGAVLAALLAGGEVMCPGGIDLNRLPGWLETCRPTWFTAAPTVYTALREVASRSRTSTVRFLRTASAPLPPQLQTDLEQTVGAPVLQAWGLTETAGQVTAVSPDDDRRPGTVGKALHGFTVVVLDDAGEPCPPGTPGEVVVRGGTPASGYFDDEAATAETFRADGLRTRDIGVLDGDGNLFIHGRRSDYANRGGQKVWLPDVDTACLGHPDVREAMAFATPHPRLGQDVAAAVVPRDESDFDAAALRNYLRGRLPQELIPRRVEVVSALPVGPSGKAQRRLLAELFPGTVPTQRERTTSNATPLTVAVTALWCDVLDLAEIDEHEDFLAAGGDSILATKLIAGVSEVLGVDLPLGSVFNEANTVSAMVRVVHELRAEADRGRV